MNRARTASSSFALMVSLIAASAFAAGQAASPPPEWARPDNQRHARNGEAVYRCATEEHGPKARFDESSGQANLGLGITAGGRIPVYFHVIYLNSEGNVPESQLDAQIQVLNFNYAGLDYNGHAVSGAANTGYTFYKAGVTRTNNRKWFRMTPGTRAETQAKSSLAINPAGALNVYICKPGQNLLGWSVFPWWTAGRVSRSVQHGGNRHARDRALPRPLSHLRRRMRDRILLDERRSGLRYAG